MCVNWGNSSKVNRAAVKRTEGGACWGGAGTDWQTASEGLPETLCQYGVSLRGPGCVAVPTGASHPQSIGDQTGSDPNERDDYCGGTRVHVC